MFLKGILIETTKVYWRERLWSYTPESSAQNSLLPPHALHAGDCHSYFSSSVLYCGEKKRTLLSFAFLLLIIHHIYSSFFFLFGYDSKMEIISALGRWVRRQCSAPALQGLIAGLSARFTVSCSATAPARHCLLVKAWSVLINSVSVEAGVQRISGQFDPTCQNCLLITMRLKSCTWAWSAVSPPPPNSRRPLASPSSEMEICWFHSRNLPIWPATQKQPQQSLHLNLPLAEDALHTSVGPNPGDIWPGLYR